MARSHGASRATCRCDDTTPARPRSRRPHRRLPRRRALPDGPHRREDLAGREPAVRTPTSRCLSDDEQACVASGRLYQWQDALTACPSGFRLPSEGDWRELERHLGVPALALDATGPRGADEGTRLRVFGDTGFDVVLAGYRRPDGTPRRTGERAAFWSSTTDQTAPPSSPRAWHRDLSSDPRIYRSPVEIDYWLSIRCVSR
jgi:uncharacterized protein (TIGR02145 family)